MTGPVARSAAVPPRVLATPAMLSEVNGAIHSQAQRSATGIHRPAVSRTVLKATDDRVEPFRIDVGVVVGVISEHLLECLRADFDLIVLSWGLVRGSGEPIYLTGDPVELIYPPGDADHEDVFLLTPSAYLGLGSMDDSHLALNLANELQATAMELSRKPFPVTEEGHILSVATDEDADLWWMNGDAPFARVGCLSSRV